MPPSLVGYRVLDVTENNPSTFLLSTVQDLKSVGLLDRLKIFCGPKHLTQGKLLRIEGWLRYNRLLVAP